MAQSLSRKRIVTTTEKAREIFISRKCCVIRGQNFIQLKNEIYNLKYVFKIIKIL